MATTTMSDKLVRRLQSGKTMTVPQIIDHCGFSSPNSVYGTIARLREEGFKIETTTNRSGATAYSLG